MKHVSLLLVIGLLYLASCGPARQTLSLPTQPERMGVAEGVARGRLKGGEQYAYGLLRSFGVVRVDHVAPRFSLEFYLSPSRKIDGPSGTVRLHEEQNATLNRSYNYVIVVNRTGSPIDYEFNFVYEAPWVGTRRDYYDPAEAIVNDPSASDAALEQALRDLNEFQRRVQQYIGARDLMAAADSLSREIHETLTDQYFSVASRYLSDEKFDEAAYAVQQARIHASKSPPDSRLYPPEAIDKLEASILLQQGIQARGRAEVYPWNEKHTYYQEADQKLDQAAELALRIKDDALINAVIDEAALTDISKAQATLVQAEEVLAQAPAEAIGYAEEAREIVEVLQGTPEVERKMRVHIRKIMDDYTHLTQTAASLRSVDDAIIQVNATMNRAESLARSREFFQAIQEARRASEPLKTSEQALQSARNLRGIDIRLEDIQQILNGIYSDINRWQKLSDIDVVIEQHDRLLANAAALSQSNDIGRLDTAIRHYNTVIAQGNELAEISDPLLDTAIRGQATQAHTSRAQTLFRKAKILYANGMDEGRSRSNRQAALREFLALIEPSMLNPIYLSQTDRVLLKENQTKAYAAVYRNLYEEVRELLARDNHKEAQQRTNLIGDSRLKRAARLEIAEWEVRRTLQVAGDLSGRGENRKAIRALQQAEEMAKTYQLNQLSQDIRQQISILEQELPTITRQNPLTDRPQRFKQDMIEPGKSANVLIPVNGSADIQIYVPNDAGDIRLTALNSDGGQITVRGPLSPIIYRGTTYVPWVIWARDESRMVEIPFENAASRTFDMAQCLYVEVEPSY